MNKSEYIVGRFGSQSELARLLGVGQSTVQYWCSKGTIPAKWHNRIIASGKQVGIHIVPLEFSAGHEAARWPDVKTDPPHVGLPSPFAKWRGKIDLGGDELDVYVLDTKQRVIALRSAVKAMTNVDSGKLGNYIGVSALKPFISSDLILSELLEFSIPGTQFKGMGLTTEQFELICRGYVQALYEGAPLTDKQRETAIKCAVLTAGLTRIAWMRLFEATGLSTRTCRGCPSSQAARVYRGRVEGLGEDISR